MFKTIIASLVFGSSATVTMVEMYNWNQMEATNQSSQSHSIRSSSEHRKETKSGSNYFTLSKEEDYIRYLKMNLDNNNKLEVVREEKIPGKWKKRPQSLGSKIYYETINYDGEVTHRGSRPDPRKSLLTNNYRGSSVPLILSIPWQDNVEEIKLYAIYTNEHSRVKKDFIASHKLKAM